jgi:hypothetical protein
VRTLLSVSKKLGKMLYGQSAEELSKYLTALTPCPSRKRARGVLLEALIFP